MLDPYSVSSYFLFASNGNHTSRSTILNCNTIECAWCIYKAPKLISLHLFSKPFHKDFFAFIHWKKLHLFMSNFFTLPLHVQSSHLYFLCLTSYSPFNVLSYWLTHILFTRNGLSVSLNATLSSPKIIYYVTILLERDRYICVTLQASKIHR